MGRLFGTDGVRGVANKELTATLAYEIGRAASYVLGNGNHRPVFLIGRDTRISGELLENALAAGIMSVGGDVISWASCRPRQWHVWCGTTRQMPEW